MNTLNSLCLLSELKLIVVDYMGKNKYQLNYKNLIEEYKNRLAVYWLNDKFEYLFFDIGTKFNRRNLSLHLVNRHYLYIYDSVGYRALLPVNY